MRRDRNEKPTVVQLLKEYARHPVMRFFQLQGVVGRSPEKIEYALSVDGEQYELRSYGDVDLPVSILIHENAQREDVVALLRHAADCLEESWYAVTIPENVERMEQQHVDQVMDTLEAQGKMLHAESMEDVDEFLKRLGFEASGGDKDHPDYPHDEDPNDIHF